MQEHISSLMQQREVLLPDVLGHNVQSYLGVNNVILCLLGKQWGVGGGWRKKRSECFILRNKWFKKDLTLAEFSVRALPLANFSQLEIQLKPLFISPTSL